LLHGLNLPESEVTVKIRVREGGELVISVTPCRRPALVRLDAIANHTVIRVGTQRDADGRWQQELDGQPTNSFEPPGSNDHARLPLVG
jgi:hypothetical protein